MTEAEYTITVHIRIPDRVFDPAFSMTLQCRNCSCAWFKQVYRDDERLALECIYCGTITNGASLFTAIDQSTLHFDD